MSITSCPRLVGLRQHLNKEIDISPVRNKVRDRARKKERNKIKNSAFLKRKEFLRKIRKWDDPILKHECEVVQAEEDVSHIVKDLKTVLAYTKDGVGLAASQIGYTKRIIALRLNANKEPVIMINPEIVDKSNNTITGVEGCLSYPGVFSRVERASKVQVSYLDEGMKPKKEWKLANESIVVQHEIEHLSGICKIGEYYFSLSEDKQLRLREGRN